MTSPRSVIRGESPLSLPVSLDYLSFTVPGGDVGAILREAQGFLGLQSVEDRKRGIVSMSGRKGLGVKTDDFIDQLEANALAEVADRHPELSDEEQRAAAHKIAVLLAPNTSLGVAVLSSLVAQAAEALGEGYDVEISEAHHRSKRDAPSGTALSLGEAVANARGRSLNDVAVYDRHATSSPRSAGSIGFSVVRAGDIVGEHTVMFAAAGERVEITHRATDRMTFARGALRAAAWLLGRPPGLYGMQDVLRVEKKHGQ